MFDEDDDDDSEDDIDDDADKGDAAKELVANAESIRIFSKLVFKSTSDAPDSPSSVDDRLEGGDAEELRLEKAVDGVDVDGDDEV